MCSPSRSALITGTYQTHFDAHNHRSNRDKPLRADMKLITDCFREAGYFTCNSPGPPYDQPGKTDFNFRREQSFDGIDLSERAPGRPFTPRSTSRTPTASSRRTRNVPLRRSRLNFRLTTRTIPSSAKTGALYLESVQIVDRKVGQILDRLDSEGLSDNTIVFFMSDHGRGHIRCKKFLYDGGIRIPLIVRWPGHFDAGAVKDELVSGVDFTPTTLALTGIEIPVQVQGQVFLGSGATTRHAVYAARDRCDGMDDRIGCIRTQRYKLIRNYHPERSYMQFNGYKKQQYPLWSLLPLLSEKGELSPAQQHFVQPARPAEELYGLEADPHEINNLAADPDYDTVRRELAGQLDSWIKETGDMGGTPESPEVTAYWDENMAESSRKEMERRGLPPGISDEDYVAWWENQLL